MAIALVSHNETAYILSPSPASMSLTGLTAASSGHVVILSFVAPTAAAISSLALTNVTWTSITTQASNTNYTNLLYYGIVSGGSSGTTLTATWTGGTAGQPILVQFAEFSGVNTSSVLDVTASNAQAVQGPSTSATCTSSSITTTAASDLVIAQMSDAGTGASFGFGTGPGNSFTQISALQSGDAAIVACQLAYRLPGSTGTYSSSQGFTAPFNSNHYCTSIITSLFAAATAARRRGAYMTID